MENIEILKKDLRESFSNKRKQMSGEEIRLKSKSICEIIIDCQDFQQAKQLFCYYPLGNEVDILPLIIESFRSGKVVCFPKVLNKTTIKFYQVTSLDDLEIGCFNVMEPKTTLEIIPTHNDLMIVPGLIFDKTNARIGYGGGYYDRYIQTAMTLNPKFATFGVCFEWQLIESLPTADYDQKVERIINERF